MSVEHSLTGQRPQRLGRADPEDVLTVVGSTRSATDAEAAREALRSAYERGARRGLSAINDIVGASIETIVVANDVAAEAAHISKELLEGVFERTVAFATLVLDAKGGLRKMSDAELAHLGRKTKATASAKKSKRHIAYED